MIFTLEVLQAKHGDCLMLHYGDADSPKTILIDGGPGGVYDDHLLPRIEELKAQLSPDDPFEFSMVMVSHMDDDHANGICRLTDDILSGNVEVNIQHLGRQLRNNSAAIPIPLNYPFKTSDKGKNALVRTDTGQAEVQWDELKITVLSPGNKRLEALQKQWDKDLKKALADGDHSIVYASMLDNSPFNVSSIACMVECGGKKILLTGDGRSDDILTGLQENGFLDENGRLHLDILKMPHHGSKRNMEESFLQAVTADHYVISADGSNDNPDKALLDIFAGNITAGTIHFTNAKGKKNIEQNLMDFQEQIAGDGSGLQVNILNDGQSFMTINLLDNFGY